jgi:hypothetical protein
MRLAQEQGATIQDWFNLLSKLDIPRPRYYAPVTLKKGYTMQIMGTLLMQEPTSKKLYWLVVVHITELSKTIGIDETDLDILRTVSRKTAQKLLEHREPLKL